MFSSKDNKPEVVVKKEAQSWDDKLASASPQKAIFFDAVRSDAYENLNLVSNYVEFWAALQVDKTEDKWRVMHYMIFDLNLPDGKFKSETVSKDDCSFAEAIYSISKFETMAKGFGAHTPVELSPEKYPVDKYPELKVYFYDMENYKTAANIEGMAFDEAGHPYRTVGGKVFSTTTLTRSEAAKPITGIEHVHGNPKVIAKIEGGILSDIFNTSSPRVASLDDIVKAGQALVQTDLFAACMGAFYLGIQKAIGSDDKFDKIHSLAGEEKETLYKGADDLLSVYGGTIPKMLFGLLPAARTHLDEAKKIGVHVEPFQKHLAECNLYAHLLYASQNRSKFQDSLKSANGADMNSLAIMQESVKNAQEKFIELGGTIEHFDRLQAWVANPKKDQIPQWLPGFIDRYYDQRRKTMNKVQERQAGAREINTMSVKVKPPIIE